MNEPAQNNVMLELHVPDFEIVKEYYTRLGFKVVWERKPEEFKGYLVIQRGNNVLCFWAGNEYVHQHPFFSKFPKDTTRGFGVEIVIIVEDVEKFYSQVKEFANVVEELVEQPWGLKDFRTADPFGYYLRFTTPHNILDVNNAVD
jgi:lactoylglutathione lyase